jgi:hypothetical protein
LIQNAALDGNLRVSPRGKPYAQGASGDSNEIDAIQSSVRRTSNCVDQVQSSQNWPTRGVDTIAANLFTRKIFPFQKERSKAGFRAKSGTARASRAASDDRYIEHERLSATDLGMQNVFFAEAFWRKMLRCRPPPRKDPT